jgi:hypothetical protein
LMLQRRQNKKLFCNHLTSNFHLETRLTFQLHPTEPANYTSSLTIGAKERHSRSRKHNPRKYCNKKFDIQTAP